MKRFKQLCVVAMVMVVSAPLLARANLVLDWSQTSEEVAGKLGRPVGQQAQLIAHLAMFNALNAIDPRFAPYVTPGAPAPDPAPTASPEAAAAAAMFTALSSQPDVDHATLAKVYKERIDKVKDANAKAAGIALGRAVALRLLAARAADRMDRIEPAALEPAPGRFTLPPESRMRASAATGRLKPFGIRSIEAYDPGPPPAATSEAALKDIREIKAAGAINSSTRTADETAAALFWNSDPLSGEFHKLIRTALEPRKLSLVETARILALDLMAEMDASIAEVAFKEKYGQWRPETAIAGAHAHASLRDPAWKPLTRTPAQEEYPGGFPVLGGLLSVTMVRLYEMKFPLQWRNPRTGQTRTWPDVTALSREVGFSRLWTGAHYRHSIEAGLTLGQRIANDVIDQQLRPLR